MFEEETLFILGAGASYSYGYPLGKELITAIIENIEQDYILLPMLNGIIWNDNAGKEVNGKLDNGYSFDDFKCYLEKEVEPDFFINIPKIYENNKSISGSVETKHIPNGSNTNYMKIKFNQINQFFALKKALISFNPVSIDAFLRDNPSYEETGKIMIIYSLLKHENKDKFAMATSNTDNWYSYLLNDIFSGCVDKPANLLNNKLNFITFNYDMSLDYYLCTKVSHTEIFQEKDIANTFIEQLKNERIIHVYGKLYEDDAQTAYGNFASDTSGRNANSVNYFDMRRFVKALQSKDNIKLIYSDRNNQDRSIILGKIKAAKEIIIIGFGFDRDNLSILGFPSNLKEYQKFLGGKIIKYMDYEGKMNNLANQFASIEELNKRNLHSRP